MPNIIEKLDFTTQTAADPTAPPYQKPLTSTTNITYSVTNYECQQSSGVIDSNGLLTGSYRTNYLGRRGHEIYNP